MEEKEKTEIQNKIIELEDFKEDFNNDIKYEDESGDAWFIIDLGYNIIYRETWLNCDVERNFYKFNDKKEIVKVSDFEDEILRRFDEYVCFRDRDDCVQLVVKNTDNSIKRC